MKKFELDFKDAGVFENMRSYNWRLLLFAQGCILINISNLVSIVARSSLGVFWLGQVSECSGQFPRKHPSLSYCYLLLPCGRGLDLPCNSEPETHFEKFSNYIIPYCRFYETKDSCFMLSCFSYLSFVNESEWSKREWLSLRFASRCGGRDIVLSARLRRSIMNVSK